MRISFYLFMLIGCLLIVSGCSSNDGKKIAQPTVITKKSDFGDPFRFHKLIEVSPGQDYDILSWGRGSKTDGAFLVLHSDSSGKKYTTTTGDLDGVIVDVYNSDMDLDGNPEILIQAKAKDTASYATIYVFEFNNGKANKLDFPKLTSSQRRGYHGNDNFYVKEGKFMREFPIYDGSDKDAKPTGAKRVFEYNLRSNNLTAKQLSKDSTDNKTAEKAVVKQQSKASTTNKKQKTSKKKSKKQATEKKITKKKKHRRHKSSADDN